MKSMKKILALALTLMLVLSLATVASARTITLVGSDKSPTTGHTYTVYQIFTGSLETLGEGADAKQVLTDVKYGMNYLPGGATVDTLVPAEELEAITDARVFADSLLEGGKLTGTYGSLNEGNSWKLEGVPAGYYLIVDSTENLPDYHTRSAYIVQVVDDVNMAPKSGVVNVVKNVKDVNDSTGEASDWQDSADYDIGDDIPYQIVTTITEIGEFKDYAVTLTDTMSKGLTYNNDAVVKMTYTYLDEDGTLKTGDKDITEYLPVATKQCADTTGAYVGGTVLTLTNSNIKALVTEGNLISATITVSYTAKLNEYALTGASGNPNKVNLTYDREPDGDGTGTTPDDVNVIFTFKTVVDKVDPQGDPLTGAEFRLDKFVASDEGTETYAGKKGTWTTLQLVKNDDGTVFSFTGLDDGYYRVVETKAPEGYNSIDPIYFEVNAEHVVDNVAPTLTQLTADALKIDGTAYTPDEKDEDDSIPTFTLSQTGDITTSIVNKPGLTLPETGGMGTTVFYVIGGLLVAAAVVLLVTKKRMASAE